MAGYVMVTIHEIHDAGKLQRYREAAIPSLRKYGGTAVVRPGNRQQFGYGVQWLYAGRILEPHPPGTHDQRQP